MQLWLKHEHFSALITHAQQEAPNEACGVLLGVGEEVKEVITLKNISPTPKTHYAIEPQGLVQAIMNGQSRGLDLVGLYHSHPSAPPIPSTTDIMEAQYPNTPYIIIGLKQAKAKIAAWHIHYGAVTPVELHIGEKPAFYSEDKELSRAQKTAIILAALVAVLLVLVISFNLLPPPPPLTMPPGR